MSSASRTPLLLVLAAWACSPAPDAAPDLLLVTLDTLRSDFVGAYGYPRAASPTLDRLASEGALFEAHFTTIPTTAPAHASMFTGLTPGEHGLTRNGHSLPEGVRALPEVLRERGYRTGAAIGVRILGSQYGFARGFDWFDEDFDDTVLRPTGKTAKYERYGESVVDRALAFAARDDGRPTFLWVHLYDVHEPYSPPRVSPIHPEAAHAWFRRRAHPSELFERAELVRMLAAYEAEVTYVDEELARLFEGWWARPAGAGSLVAVLSDHGEGLGEHAYQAHGFLLYEEQVRVPFLLHMPGAIEPGRRVRSVTSTLDVPATLLDLLGIDPAAAGMTGSSLRPLLEREEPGRAAFAERRTYGPGDLRRDRRLRELVSGNVDRPVGSIGDKFMLVRGGWKLVWNENGHHELYELEGDPDEAANRLADEPERAGAMLAELEAWRERTRLSDAASQDAEPGGETRDMLDALGY